MSDYLSDEEQLDKLKTWWQKNGITLLVGVAVAVAGVVGWRWYDSHRSDLVARSSDLYSEYLAAEGEARESLAAAISAEFPDSTYQTLVLVRLARAQMAQEDVEGARAYLEQALAQAPDAVLADMVRLRLARVLQQLDQSDDAFTLLAEVKNLGYRSQVLELKGDIHLTRGERGEAHEAYTAALAEAGDDQQGLLELKIADTADTNDP